MATQPEGFGSKGVSSLAAVTADANGTALPFGRARHTHGLQVVLTGSPTGGTITLQGSMNGTNWVSLGAVFTIGTDTSGDMKFAVDKPCLFVRAVLASLAGGTTPTVTALIASV